ncbi:MAG TPA: heavy metal-responsive transcriptional regulator [Pyrinomonadaceae bacterium]|jgi:DNA-binding transcriptional MerR regulator
MNRAATNSEQTDAQQEKMLKIGEVSKQSGVGIEALRFYERSGLLGRTARTESGYRIYDPEVLERLEFIKRAQVLGFSLDEIKQVINEKRAGHSPCAAVREIVRRRLQELDERMREMNRYRDDLAAALAKWDEAGEVEGHICGLIEATEIDHRIARNKLTGKRKAGK